MRRKPRRLHVEHLEPRRLLAAVTVSNDLDLINGDTSSIANLIASDGGDGIALREAIVAANMDVAADTIDFDASLSGDTLLLTAGELVISEELTIDASALTGNITIDAQQNSRIFNITAATGDFTFRGLTLTGGKTTDSGGAILSYSDGNLNFDQSTISGNSAVISGGGFVTSGNVTLTNSTVSGNHAAETGGGFIAGGDATLTNSTLSGNSNHSAPLGSSGAFAIGHVTITNSTITDNSETVAGPSSGTIFASSGITITNSIVAGNTAGGVAADLGNGSTLAVNYSLIGDTSNLNAGRLAQINAGTGNLLDIDPHLGPLTNNGGPTKTHALLAGSPAIDAGDPLLAMPPTHDQRGNPYGRIADGNADAISRIDIGAFEVPTTYLVTTNVDENDVSIDPNVGAGTSLREVIEFANIIPQPINITFDPSLDGTTILLELGELVITDELTIDASSLTGDLTIDAQQNSRLFNIANATGDVTIRGLTLTGGKAVGGSGGAIVFYGDGNLPVDGNLTIEYTIISGNTADESGGGLAAYADVTLSNSSVSGNRAYKGGGGIAGIGDIVLINSTVNDNSVFGDDADGGGGIFSVGGGFVTLTNSTVSGNSSSGMMFGGGGIFSLRSVTLDNSTVSGNSDSSTGTFRGGIIAATGITTLSNSIVAGNTSNGSNLDLRPFSALDINYSLIGDTTGLSASQIADINAGTGNIIDINPRLGPLANNGGPTKTHALLPGSPAIDAGNSTSPTDQRGNSAPVDLPGYANAPGGNGRDIGAYEAQVAPTADFDDDQYITGLDFLAWQLGFGSTTATKPQGNSDDDSDTDASDLAAWETTFGGGPPLAADFDSSGAVTGLDFLAWQRGFGTPAPFAAKYDGDADDNTTVNTTDRTIWEAQFGQQAPVAFSTPTPLAAPLTTAKPIDLPQPTQPINFFLHQEMFSPLHFNSPATTDIPAPHKNDTAETLDRVFQDSSFATISEHSQTPIKAAHLDDNSDAPQTSSTDEAFALLADDLLDSVAKKPL